jgi:hypothetical protein
MAKSQPAYDSQKFKSITKTLWLWYKIVFDLMHTCDVVGNYLGFTKREEHKKYWTWFNYQHGSDQRLNFSKLEFESVQNWLNESLSANLNKLTLSPRICVSKPSFVDDLTEAEGSSAQLAKNHLSHLQPSMHKRQISFELKSTKSSSNIFGSQISPSISDPIDQTALDHELPQKSLSNIKDLVNSLLQIKNNTEENEHLKAVKLHHLNSFLSRSSSYKSNDSPSSSGLSSCLNMSIGEMHALKTLTPNREIEFYLSNDNNNDV